MQGSRKYTNDEGDLALAPGEYGWQPYANCWYCCTPNGHYGDLSSHEVIEHEDKTISVSPSILVSDDTGELWHGYLERGIWREV